MGTAQACEAEGIKFIPVIAEADGGGWGPKAHQLWNELAKRRSSITGEPESVVACQLLQTLGITLHRENARAILRRWPNPAYHGCRTILTAAVTAATTSHRIAVGVAEASPCELHETKC